MLQKKWHDNFLLRALWVITLLLGYLVFDSATAFALEPATTGVVLLHGKGGEPSGLIPASDALKQAGYTVVTPTLPWANNRNYDQPYGESIAEVAKAVADLRQKGLRNIVVGGHSMGGNAALRYATQDEKLSAVVLIAAAHFPEGETARKLATDSVNRARNQIAAGNVTGVDTYIEVPSGKPLQLTAPVYLSYYDPIGPAAMSLFASNVKTSRIAWFAASHDPATGFFANLVIPHLPVTVQLTRIDIDSDHGHAALIAAKGIVDWLKALPEQ